ncbi:MAG: L-lysine 6-transaminase [Phycisphaerae bacterium]|nr:L-lysine 6-transaminase [Phycisphaerae bacterium]
MHATHAPHGMTPAEALETLKRRILVDGFHMVADLEACRGTHLRDGLSGHDYLDFYSYFASQPISYNHPRMHEPAFQQRLLTAATTRVANSDVYTQMYAEFVRTLDRVAGLPGFEYFFFIDGGALANENALKAAFDWKVRKNIAAGRGDELGTRVLHFKQAFHGRTGYTMSLTNTDPNKTMYFPKFDWPRIENPKINFDLPEPQRTADVAAREAVAVLQIEQACERYKHDIAAMILEPIQGEGGDNHFRPEFLRKLRELADQHEFLLIFDEVQTGVGLTGRMWCCEHFGVYPDILVFGKKMQQCGIMATRRVDDVPNVFKVPSRINSTWGGNLADMVRATQYLEVIESDKLVENAEKMGTLLQDGLQRLRKSHPILSNVRGRGLMCAFDLPTGKLRDKLREVCLQHQMLVLSCGPRSVRFRPVLDIRAADIEAGMAILDKALTAVDQ